MERRPKEAPFLLVEMCRGIRLSAISTPAYIDSRAIIENDLISGKIDATARIINIVVKALAKPCSLTPNLFVRTRFALVATA